VHAPWFAFTTAERSPRRVGVTDPDGNTITSF